MNRTFRFSSLKEEYACHLSNFYTEWLSSLCCLRIPTPSKCKWEILLSRMQIIPGRVLLSFSRMWIIRGLGGRGSMFFVFVFLFFRKIVLELNKNPKKTFFFRICFRKNKNKNKFIIFFNVFSYLPPSPGFHLLSTRNGY